MGGAIGAQMNTILALGYRVIWVLNFIVASILNLLLNNFALKSSSLQVA